MLVLVGNETYGIMHDLPRQICCTASTATIQFINGRHSKNQESKYRKQKPRSHRIYPLTSCAEKTVRLGAGPKARYPYLAVWVKSNFLGGYTNLADFHCRPTTMLPPISFNYITVRMRFGAS